MKHVFQFGMEKQGGEIGVVANDPRPDS